MARHSRERHKGRIDSGWFFRLPIAVLNSSAYCGLSFKARSLLMDFGSQFRGHNNGDFTMAWSLMRKRGWVSKQTLENARDELLKAGFIMLTRQGGRCWPSLYAVTWLPIDECHGKLEVPASKVATNDWRKAGMAST